MRKIFINTISIFLFFFICCLFENSFSAIGISGDIGFDSELYSVSTGENRRPASSARLYFRPTINILNTFKINLDFNLSTDGSSSRQDINQIDINPKWSWGNAHFGDFSQSYSPLVLEGIKIRGAALNVQKGKIKFGFVTGKIKRSVSSQNNYRSYERVLYGGLIGLGEKTGSYFNILAISAKDDISSLSDINYDTTSLLDTITYDTIINPESITPQENMVLSLQSNLSFAKHKFSWSNEFAASAFTRDRRSSVITTHDIPDFLTNIFTVRISTNADFGYISKFKLKLSKLKFDAGYKYIGPGYISLGLATIKNDIQELKLGSSYRLKSGNIRLTYARENDNLINQKSYTTDRNRIGSNLNIRPLKNWSMMLNSTYITMKNNAVGQAQTDYHTLNLSTNQVVGFSSRVLKKASFNYIFVNSNDNNPLRLSSKLQSHTSKLMLVLIARSNIRINPAVSMIRTKQGNSDKWLITKMYNITSNHTILANKLKTVSQITYTNGEESNSFQAKLKTSYSITERINSRIECIYKKFKSEDASKTNFDEVTVRLSLSKSF